jgi:hypothetical protein
MTSEALLTSKLARLFDNSDLGPNIWRDKEVEGSDYHCG